MYVRQVARQLGVPRMSIWQIEKCEDICIPIIIAEDKIYHGLGFILVSAK